MKDEPMGNKSSENREATNPMRYLSTASASDILRMRKAAKERRREASRQRLEERERRRKEKEDLKQLEQNLERKLELKMLVALNEYEASRLDSENKREFIKLIVVVLVTLIVYTMGNYILHGMLAFGKKLFFGLIDWLWLV